MSVPPLEPQSPHPGHEVAEAHGTAPVSIHSAPGTGRTLARGAGGLAIVLLLGFILAFAVRQHGENQAKRSASARADLQPTVDVAAVRPTAQSYPLELPGQTGGWYESAIFARVDGYVASWTADIGDRVKQGQVLARIDTPELDQQLNAVRAKAAFSAAQEAVAEADVSIAKLTDERWRDSPKGVVSEQEREEKQAAYAEADARLTAAKAQTRLDEAEVGRYAALAAFKAVTAPYDGVITARDLDVGDLVSAGSSSSNHSLYRIAQSNRIRVFVDVPQKLAADTVVGLPADIASDQFPGRSFPGTVARSAMSIDPQTRTQRTEVDVANPDLALVPGMYVQVTFQLRQRGRQEVPAAAILFRPAGLQVAVVEPSGRVEFRRVLVAQDNGDTVVLASGVNPGERVALNLSSAIHAGEIVTAVAEADNAQPVSLVPAANDRPPALAAAPPTH
jgi:RND family efflux transporter MFP subunit